MNRESMVVTIGQRGVMTVPKQIREAYHLKEGDEITLLDLGGAFVLSPRRSEIDALSDRLERKLKGKGESLESMLLAIREERARYGKRR
ncbi:MAG: AbrB/MazE/SpoVT family DNA-binding domain-containing protein [Kiritimatiellae bacterium]|nr:AbrB/MazE/SpoVT family DNA-binding domain-containing protein [Kiritimatiellia bacterium]